MSREACEHREAAARWVSEIVRSRTPGELAAPVIYDNTAVHSIHIESLRLITNGHFWNDISNSTPV